MASTTAKAKIGDIVYFHSGGADTDEGSDSFLVAAIVTMTPQQWQPGYRTPDGEWVPTPDVKQPSQGCVHLTLFTPPGVADTAQVKYSDVREGTTHGCWSAR